MYHKFESKEGLLYVTLPELTELGFANAITTRLGGVSKGPYAELNLGLHTGDDPGAVLENRARLAKVIGFSRDSMVLGQQVHGDKVAVVKEEDRGKGAECLETALPMTDGLITGASGILLGGFFADCVPILLADPVMGNIGLVHAGWKGTAQRIAMKAVDAINGHLGTAPDSLMAVIGPSIGPCCYHVRPDVLNRIEDSLPEDASMDSVFYGKREEGGYLDLWKVNKRQLMAAGLTEERIHITGICTSCLVKLFFSHRAEGGVTGRLGAFIGRLKNE